MQTSLDPSVLTSSPIRKLYEVLSVFEQNRDWSKSARIALLEKVAARAPSPHQLHQPDVFLFNSMLEDLGVDPIPELDINESETIPGISLLSRSSLRTESSVAQSTESTMVNKETPTLSPQLANLMTSREMAAYAMLQLFGELSEQRIESWGRVARMIVTQPMDGFATVKPEWTSK